MSATLAQSNPLSQSLVPTYRPRVGFLGLGWIGRNRMEAIAQSNLVEIVALSDLAPNVAKQAAEGLPGAEVAQSYEDMLEMGVDGVAIATPSALHAEQAAEALERGVAVFCQKPLGRTESETASVIEIARRKNRLLSVDFSYRFITCLGQLRELCLSGELGEIYAVDLMFHNAYGPDKPWFYDGKLSGGGCVIDLGVHLVDLALWNLNFPKTTKVTSNLFAGGKRKAGRSGQVEDYADATLSLETGATVHVACSWKAHAGRDAIISGSFFGARGGAAFHNLDGSFYDFIVERFDGTRRQTLNCLRENWGGRGAVFWARQLAKDGAFEPEVEQVREVAFVLDAIYHSA